MSFSSDFLNKCSAVLAELDSAQIETAAMLLSELKMREGRLFIIGSGGGAGHASHATCDFRKLCNIEAYAPYDNTPELTARVNDDGWDSTLVNWLKVSRFSEKDCLLVFSVGGGSQERNISPNLVNALRLAQSIGAVSIGIVGKNGGETAKIATVTILIPEKDEKLVTPLTEGVQAIVWHILAAHPVLQAHEAKWESATKANRKE
ncbi:MAG: SIS domain-containing protein [Candidatus Obscuribacterales bacterium]|nr:SIS domain-containing protein [Candidatus Obscuribacterales bacterium]